MQLLVIGTQIFLGVALFFIINWIGRHSYSLGYMEISMFVREEESPAFNFLFRTLTPVVYIIIIAAVFYRLNLDFLTTHLYWVNIYYIVFRLGFNLLTGRGRLLNWNRQFLYWIAITVLSVFVYDRFIKTRANILPDFGSMANELWLIVLIFLFQVTNSIRIRKEMTEKRKANFLRYRLHSLEKKFGTIVNQHMANGKLRALAYAIMIYEDFNRPKIARIIETLFRFGKVRTLGIMQVTSRNSLSDMQSVVLGCKKICEDYSLKLEELKSKGIDPWYDDDSLARYIAIRYNPDDSYGHEVIQLWNLILESHTAYSQDNLIPENLAKRREDH